MNARNRVYLGFSNNQAAFLILVIVALQLVFF